MSFALSDAALSQSTAQEKVPSAGATAPQQTTNDLALGIGDELTIWALGVSEITDKPITVDDQGVIDLPLVGAVHAAGLTAPELRERLIQALKKYVQEPQVSVRVTEVRSRPVSVIGAVNRPGVYQMRRQNTVLESLSLAGGLAPDAGQAVNVIRGARSTCPPLHTTLQTTDGSYSTSSLPAKELIDAKRPDMNLVLCANDTVSVPSADTVFVVGEVQKPGAFPIHDRASYTVLQALTLAGGLTPNAGARDSRIIRDAQSSNRKEIPIDLRNILNAKGQDTVLMAGDVLFVPNSVPKAATKRAIDAALQLAIGIAIFRR